MFDTTITCPHCRRRLQAPAGFLESIPTHARIVGTIRCPQCGKSIPVDSLELGRRSRPEEKGKGGFGAWLFQGTLDYALFLEVFVGSCVFWLTLIGLVILIWVVPLKEGPGVPPAWPFKVFLVFFAWIVALLAGKTVRRFVMFIGKVVGVDINGEKVETNAAERSLAKDEWKRRHRKERLNRAKKRHFLLRLLFWKLWQ